MKLKVEFSGGLELMFEGQRNIDIELQGEGLLLENLIEDLRANHLKDKEEMFIQGGTVRPGIIVLINDTDWELLDSEKYALANGD